MFSFVVLFAAGAEPTLTLPADEAAAGWVRLFDGATTFGWNIAGDARVEHGDLVLGGSKETIVTRLAIPGEYRWEYQWEPKQKTRWRVGPDEADPQKWSLDGVFSGAAQGKATWNAERLTIRHTPRTVAQQVECDNQRFADVPPPGMTIVNRLDVSSVPAVYRLTVPAGETFRVRNVRFRPDGLTPIFDGKDLSGWKVFAGEKYKSVYSVTPEGWLNVRNGPGDLQTEAKYQDFILQAEVKTNGRHLNSGIFLRCLPDQYQQGYEVQIRNQKGPDGKPVDFGTGAIYRRVAARAIVANDDEWFTLTIMARGRRFTTWVNGYTTADWLDERPPHENPRQGYRAGPGHISIQGHDPTTNIDFRNLRIAALAP